MGLTHPIERDPAPLWSVRIAHKAVLEARSNVLIIAACARNQSEVPIGKRGSSILSDVQRYCSEYVASWGPQAIPVDRIWCDVLFLRSIVAVKSALILIHHDAVEDAANPSRPR
jgi:hypothetical protein